MANLNDVSDFRFRRAINTAHLRRLHRAPEKHADLEKTLLRSNEEVTRLPREHDRVVRRINPLFAELGGGVAQPFPCVAQVFRQILRQRRFRRRPAVVGLAFLDPLFAVVALSTGHDSMRTTIIVATMRAVHDSLPDTDEFPTSFRVSSAYA